jgi:alcohol dehydrogenase (cytochrome c)
VDTGKIKGHHQYHYNDAWDWDEVSAPVLIDTEINGRKVKGAVHAGRNGYLWMLDRQPSGKIDFVNGISYVYNDVIKRLGQKNRPPYL